MFQDALFPEDREKLRKSFIFGTPEFRQAYKRYICSPEWRKLCKEVRRRASDRCEKCKTLVGRLEVHHVTYERFTRECLSDLLLLCVPCHEAADQEREDENQQRYEEAGEEARYQNGFRTYMAKKYGEDYYHFDESDWREYDEWLQKKNDSYGW